MTLDNAPRRETPVARKQYSEEAAREILRRAMEEETTEKDFSHEQLQAMADELGISSESLARAEQTWLAEERSVPEREDQVAFLRHRQRAFKSHVAMFAIINSFLCLLNLATGFDSLWFIYPLLGWGMGVAAHAWSVRQNEGTQYDQELAQWRAQHPLPPPSDKRLSS